MSEPNEAPIDAGEVARRLGVERKWVLAEARDGRLPCLKLGHRTVRFSWAAVARAVQFNNLEGEKEKQDGDQQRAEGE